MLVFEVKESPVFTRTVGYLFERGYFKNDNCIITTSDAKSVKDLFVYDPIQNAFIDQKNDVIDPFDIDTIYILTNEYKDGVFTSDELDGVRVGSLEEIVSSLHISGNNNLADVSSNAGKSVLDCVLEEAKGNQSKVPNTELVKHYDTESDYVSAVSLLEEMIKDHITNGRQIISTGVFFAQEIGKYMVYAIGL